MSSQINRIGIDIGSTTVKIAILGPDNEILFSDYRRHYANIQKTLCGIIEDAIDKLGDITAGTVITGSGGLAISSHLNTEFVLQPAMEVFPS